MPSAELPRTPSIRECQRNSRVDCDDGSRRGGLGSSRRIVAGHRGSAQGIGRLGSRVSQSPARGTSAHGHSPRNHGRGVAPFQRTQLSQDAEKIPELGPEGTAHSYQHAPCSDAPHPELRDSSYSTTARMSGATSVSEAGAPRFVEHAGLEAPKIEDFSSRRTKLTSPPLPLHV